MLEYHVSVARMPFYPVLLSLVIFLSVRRLVSPGCSDWLYVIYV